VLRRRQVGVAHAEVDDVPAARACCGPHRVDFGDDVGRQALDAVEIGFHDLGNPQRVVENAAAQGHAAQRCGGIGGFAQSRDCGLPIRLAQMQQSPL
jgi:hypothetical protein